MEIVIVLAPLRKHGPKRSYTEDRTLSKIALIDPDDWEKGADHVNGLIQQIIDQHNLAAEASRLKAENERPLEQLRALEQRRHNNPPEGLVDDLPKQEQLSDLTQQLDKAAQELDKPKPSRSRLVKIATALLNPAKAIAAYCGGLADLTLKEGAKALGKAGGPALVGYLVLQNEQVLFFARALMAFARSLGANPPPFILPQIRPLPQASRRRNSAPFAGHSRAERPTAGALMRALILILLFALPAQAQQMDSRLQSLQTADASRGWEAVGRLNMNGVGFCTGTLISQTHVLTAAHCLYDRTTGQRIDAAHLEFLAGWRTGRAEAIRSVRRVAIWPGFDMAAGAALTNVTTDLALLELDRPIRTTAILPFAVSPTPPRRGDAVAVVSYGRGRAEAPSIQETCHVLEQRGDGVSVFSCQIDFGSSGSPVFAVQDDELRIISVISAMADGTDSPVSLGMRLTGRIAALQEALDGGSAGPVAGQTQGARTTARFLRP